MNISFALIFQIQKTDTNLESFSTTLKDVEKCLSSTQLQEGDVDQTSVLEVLDSMSSVKHNYENLRQDLQEVQQLQKEMTSTLQYQMRSMTQTYNILRKKIEANPSLPIPLPSRPTLPLTARTTSSISSSPPSH